jgi:hypothetical protein
MNGRPIQNEVIAMRIIATRILVPSSVLAAVVLALQPGAIAQDNAPYCLKSGSGVTHCMYQTMAACEQIKQSNDQCLTRAQAGATTGSGNPVTPAPEGGALPGGNLPPPR